MPVPSTNTAVQLDHALANLLSELRDQVPEPRVRATFAAAARQFDGAPVQTFVPILVARNAKQALRSG